jgi:ribosomal protein L37AE/L43A
MTLIRTLCHFTCDGCGKPFVTRIQNAHKLPACDWTMFEFSEDSLRWGTAFGGYTDIRGGVNPRSEMGLTSVQAGKHLCPACTSVVDDFVTEDRNATADEVEAALNKRENV